MASEVFDGFTLEQGVRLLKATGELVDDVLQDTAEVDESYDSEDELLETKVECLRRFHLGGAASRVTPFKDLSDHVHKDLISNMTYFHRIPFLVQVLTPVIMAEYDTLIVAPPGKAQIEAFCIPIINKIMFSLVEDLRNNDRRPRAVILSSNECERFKIKEVIRLLTRDLPIITINVNSIDKLVSFLDFGDSKESEGGGEERKGDGKVDILITTPAAYIAFTKRRKIEKKEGEENIVLPSKIFMDRLQYLVVFEIEEVSDSGGEYSKIIANHRRENQFTLVMVTHTYFSERKNKKLFSFEHAERRSKLENLLNQDKAIVMVDSTFCIRNMVIMQDSDVAKVEHLRALLAEHKADKRCYEEKEGMYKYKRRILVVVPNAMRARFLMAFLTTSGMYHKHVVNSKHILYLEREMETREGGKWKDPMRKIRKGEVGTVITSNLHGIRMAHSVIDKVIFFDIIPNLHSLVLNCSKIVDNRRNFFFVSNNDLINKKGDLRSLVQYLKDTDTAIPPELTQFDLPPDAVKSLYV